MQVSIFVILYTLFHNVYVDSAFICNDQLFDSYDFDGFHLNRNVPLFLISCTLSLSNMSAFCRDEFSEVFNYEILCFRGFFMISSLLIGLWTCFRARFLCSIYFPSFFPNQIGHSAFSWGLGGPRVMSQYSAQFTTSFMSSILCTIRPSRRSCVLYRPSSDFVQYSARFSSMLQVF